MQVHVGQQPERSHANPLPIERCLGPLDWRARGWAMDLISDPDGVERSECLGGTRASTVYTVPASVHTNSLVLQKSTLQPPVPKPCPDVGNSEPIRVLRAPEHLVQDQRLHQHRIRVLCTARPRVVLQVRFLRSRVCHPPIALSRTP